MNKQHKFVRASLIILFLLSPLIPYLATAVYNGAILQKVTKQIRTLPVYPGARLVKTPYEMYSPVDCWQQIYHYETVDTLEQLRAFYKSNLPRNGWHQAQSGDYYDFYQSPESNIMIEFWNTPEKTTFTVFITARLLTLFDMHCQ